MLFLNRPSALHLSVHSITILVTLFTNPHPPQKKVRRKKPTQKNNCNFITLTCFFCTLSVPALYRIYHRIRCCLWQIFLWSMHHHDSMVFLDLRLRLLTLPTTDTAALRIALERSRVSVFSVVFVFQCWVGRGGRGFELPADDVHLDC